ncbi:30S ribosomal protein S17 [Candidatus Wolfebacteria bacterium]|nr:MAG: 30S ribosomal protein S17 [Candidatus Wolfebacteria bacterium]
MTTENTQKKTAGKRLVGVVVSDKMTDTIVVSVKSFTKHPKYGKFMNKVKKYKAHDKGNTKNIGDTVTIEETRPISKDKHFRVINTS